MPKVYFFKTNENADTGVFVGAENWKEARKMAIRSEIFDDYEFIEIVGNICKQNGKVVTTEKNGELEPDDLMEAGYCGFYWEYHPCDKCKAETRCHPHGGQMLCDECIEEAEAKDVS